MPRKNRKLPADHSGRQFLYRSAIIERARASAAENITTMASKMRNIKGFLLNIVPLLSILVYTVFKQTINNGDIFDIIYEPGKGTSFYKNNKFINTIKGFDMKKALFGIWIIDKPAHKCEGLRNGMLGL